MISGLRGPGFLCVLSHRGMPAHSCTDRWTERLLYGWRSLGSLSCLSVARIPLTQEKHLKFFFFQYKLYWHLFITSCFQWNLEIFVTLDNVADYWLCNKKCLQIKFKTLVTYKSLHSWTPVYVAALLRPYFSSRCLRSSDDACSVQPHF